MRNAQKAGKSTCLAPHSRLKEQLLELLKKEEVIADFAKVGEKPKFELEVTFNPDKAALTLKRISKPGRRAYVGVSELKPVLNGFGTAILTTSQGLMTDSQAREKKMGGEVLCTIS
jgi:small subunit ribosomal protein S8